MKFINFIILIVICLLCSGCVGFINGYMADNFDNQEMKEIRSGFFPAVNSDTLILRQIYENDDLNGFQKSFSTTIIGIDYPISACVDTIFLPIRGLAYTIHGKPSKDKEILIDQSIK